MNINSILGRDSHWNVNKSIARASSVDAAIMLSDFISKREYYLTNNMIENEDSFFFCTVEDVKEDTTLGKTTQAAAIKLLLDLGFIETKLIGCPMRRNIRVFDEKIATFLLSRQLDQKRPLSRSTFDHSNGQETSMIIKTNNNNKQISNIVENPMDLSTTHTPDESEIETYTGEFKSELKEIYDYLNKKIGRERFRIKSKHNKFAIARLKEGKTIEEFKKIIDSKYTEWVNDSVMFKFFRPSTLFNSEHFDEYFEMSDIPNSSNPTSTQTLAVDTEARAKADAILAEQNYHRDKISNYQIENNLFQSAKTGTVYEAIFINPNQQEVLLLALDSKEVISLSAEELKLLRYKKKVEMITKSAMQTLLTKHPDFNYHETHKEFLSQKV